MKKYYSVMILICTLALNACVEDIDSERLQFEFDMENVVENNNLPGVSIAIVHGNRIVWQGGFGRKDQQGRLVNEHTPFTIDSVSKAVLGTAISHAIDSGKISLDTPINHVLDFDIGAPNNFDEFITLRHLASHSSGIVDAFPYYDCSLYLLLDEPASLLNFFSGQPICPELLETDFGQYLFDGLHVNGLQYSVQNFINDSGYIPGSRYIYSNTGAALAARVLELSVGVAYPEYTQTQLFDPLSMHNTFWFYESEHKGNPVATGYTHRTRDGGVSDNITPVERFESSLYPDGGLKSSAHDLANFSISLLNGGFFNGQQVLSKEAVDRLSAAQSESAQSEPRGNTDLTSIFWNVEEGGMWHYGDSFGSRALLELSLEENLAVVILMNKDFAYTPEDTTDFKIRDMTWEYARTFLP